MVSETRRFNARRASFLVLPSARFLSTPRCGGEDWMNHQRSPRLLCLHLQAPCNPSEWLFDPTWSAVNLTSLFNKLEITNQSGKVGWPVAADGEIRTLRRSVLCECSDDERASWCECLPKHRPPMTLAHPECAFSNATDTSRDRHPAAPAWQPAYGWTLVVVKTSEVRGVPLQERGAR